MKNSQSQTDSSQLIKKIKCAKHNQSKFVCLNEECPNYAFVCQNQACECRVHHQDCLLVLSQTLLKKIYKKIIPVTQFQQTIETRIDQLIDQLSDLRDKLAQETRKKLKFFGINQFSQNFLSLIQSQNLSQITGSYIWQLHLKFKTDPEILKSFKSQIQKLNKTFSQCQQQIQKSIQQVFQQIQDIKLGSISSSSNFFNKSKVITGKEDITKIEKFYEKKKIKKSQLLYRASDNEFLIENFREKCLNIPDTLIICETEFGNKIGGYTPIPWKASQSVSVADESGESFVFSLTHNQKLVLINKKEALTYQNNKYGPVFGYTGWELQICDKANQKNDCCGNIGYGYQHKNYPCGKKESWQRFLGANAISYKFKAKQWEVWKLQFE